MGNKIVKKTLVFMFCMFIAGAAFAESINQARSAYAETRVTIVLNPGPLMEFALISDSRAVPLFPSGMQVSEVVNEKASLITINI